MVNFIESTYVITVTGQLTISSRKADQYCGGQWY